jgi:hypothetical protein
VHRMLKSEVLMADGGTGWRRDVGRAGWQPEISKHSVTVAAERVVVGWSHLNFQCSWLVASARVGSYPATFNLEVVDTSQTYL